MRLRISVLKSSFAWHCHKLNLNIYYQSEVIQAQTPNSYKKTHKKMQNHLFSRCITILKFDGEEIP